MRNVVLNAPVIILIVSFRIFTLEEGQDYTEEFEFFRNPTALEQSFV